MNVIEIEIDKSTQPADVLKNITDAKLKSGDTLKINSKQDEILKSVAAALLVYYAVLYYFRINMTDKLDAGKLLEEIIKRKSSKQIEKQIKNDFGINVQFQQTDHSEQSFIKEKKEWTNMTISEFGKMYAVDEPDYSDVPVREPNPEYKTWKKDR